MRNLSPDARRIIEEHPASWEYRFFAQLVEDELARAERRARASGEPTLQASVDDEVSLQGQRDGDQSHRHQRRRAAEPPLILAHDIM